MDNNKKIVYIMLVVIQCVLWALANPAIKISVETITPFIGMFARFFVAFVVFAVIFAKDTKAQINRSNAKGIVIVGVFTSGTYIFGTLGLSMTASTTAGFLLSLSVVFTPFLSYFFLRQKINKKLYFIIALVVSGMFLLTTNGGRVSFGLGEALAVVSSLCLAIALVLTSIHVKGVNPGPIATVQTGVTAVFALACALVFEDFSTLSDASTEGVVAIIYLAIGATFVVYLLQNTALTKLSAVMVSLIFCLQPVLNAVASILILGETMSVAGIVGGASITVGILLASMVSGGHKDGDQP